MTRFNTSIRNRKYVFDSLRDLLAKASPARVAIFSQESPRNLKRNEWRHNLRLLMFRLLTS